MAEFMRIPLGLIDAEDRLRPVRGARVEALAADMDLQGQLQPIRVARSGKRFLLVAGAYRLAAATQLGWDGIDATVVETTNDAELRFAEIMENLNREELNALERAEFLAELDAVWKRMNPGARHGGDRRSARVRQVREEETTDQAAILAIRSDVAETVGLSARSIRRGVLIAQGLSAATKAAVRGTWIEAHQSSLEALAKLSEDRQAEVLELLLAEAMPAGTVAEALAELDGWIAPAPAEKAYDRVVTGWAKLPRAKQAAFFDANREAVLNHARARGWI